MAFVPILGDAYRRGAVAMRRFIAPAGATAAAVLALLLTRATATLAGFATRHNSVPSIEP